MIELTYRKQDYTVELAKPSLMNGKPKMFLLNLLFGAGLKHEPRIQSTCDVHTSNQNPIEGSNNFTASAWTNVNHELIERIRRVKMNQNNLRQV